ncbi:AraC family transcriptional regulator [Nocardia sp. KC 131]|uniref:AraC family transcriptional regulator n=1 Tax=Nocardia arseniciresistens TaxID=3392119 RepID=UPI00398F34CA
MRVLMQLAAERGMSAVACLEGTSLFPEAVVDPSVEISTHEELRVLRNLLARFGAEPGLGIEAGRRCYVSMYGAWGLALISSRTLRDAVDVALRHVDLAFVFGQLTFAEVDGQARLRFDDSVIPEDLRGFLTERIMTGIHTIGQGMFSAGIPMCGVRFRHSAPANTTRHREVFELEPEFEAEINELAFDRAYLDIVMPQANDWARGTCEQLCRALLSTRRARTGVAGAVRDLLIRNPGEIPDQLAVATALFMSPRTLSRRLHDEAASFRTLVDEVRQMMSEELLTHTDMTTEQIAARLGYAEAASFIRAFRRWKGCPPQEFRARASAPRVSAATPSGLVGVMG